MKFKIIFLILVFQVGFSQKRTCGKDLFMQKLMTNPIAKQKHIELQKKFRIELEKLNNPNNKTAASPNITVYIPVAVHFPESSTTSTQKPCLRTLAQNQINILNADYNATNTDISQWTSAVSAFYPGTNIGSLNIQFVIATQNHPAGSGLVNGDKAITFGTNFTIGDDNDPMWSGYMNVVCKFADGNLGYSPLAGSPFSGEMVVIDIEAFGSGAGCTGYVPSSPYNLGRTLTHELGHFFNLKHTFDGCNTTSNCLVQGDYICDTPASDDATGGCPAVGSITNCGVKTLTMNYMDYTNDACMYMFTQGQANVMQAHYNAIASEFKPNVLANNVFLENTFSITPNPNNGEFNIRLKEVLSNYEIEIYDSLGRNVYEKQFLNNQNLENEISLKGNLAGLYFVSIKSEDAIITKKILIY